jgi:CheY-like chemotaxis protein
LKKKDILTKFKYHNKVNYQNYNWTDEKILIADDDIYSTLLLEKIMNKVGVKVVLASNGDDALQFLRIDRNITIAIIDILMPKLNGDEVVKKANEFRNDVIYIAYTADILRLNKNLCFDLGFYSCLSKPVFPIKILNTINEAILFREKTSKSL